MNTKRNAVLLMTGHSLTLLIDNVAVAGTMRGTKASVDALKGYIAARKDTLQFSEDNIKTFPWLRDVLAPAQKIILLRTHNRFIVDAPPTGFKSTTDIRKATRFADEAAAKAFMQDRGIFTGQLVDVLGGAA